MVPQNGWFIKENPIKLDDLGGPPLFLDISKKKHPAHRLTSPQKQWTSAPPLPHLLGGDIRNLPRGFHGERREQPVVLWQDVEIPLGKMDETKIWWCLCRFCVFCASEAFLLLFFCEFFQMCVLLDFIGVFSQVVFSKK